MKATDLGQDSYKLKVKGLEDIVVVAPRLYFNNLTKLAVLTLTSAYTDNGVAILLGHNPSSYFRMKTKLIYVTKTSRDWAKPERVYVGGRVQ